MRVIAAALLLLSLTWEGLSAAEHDSELLVELDRAARLWDSTGLSTYRYTLLRGGVFGGTLYEVRLRKGNCTAHGRPYIGKPKGNWRRASCEGLTIPELLADVRHQLLLGTRRAELEFDETFGYVVRFSVEPNTDLTDQDWYLEVSNFQTADAAPDKTMEPTR
jgi:Family of unknown function (DUF6174)